MINIKEKFLELTSKRYPKGTEGEVIKLIPEFEFEKDEFDNYYYIIKKKDDTFSNTMFTAHLDTVDRGPTAYSAGGKWNITTREYDYPNGKPVDDKSIKHVIDGDFIKTDGKTNLGADDKAGVVIMLNLMSENVPGLYYFFMGEESGCIGSSNLSRKFEELVKNEVIPKVNKCVSFDRKGYDSIITEQSGGVCASDEFAKELSDRLNKYGFWFKGDDGGVYTDSAEFIDVIEECTNLSVGYFSEHTTSERQDIEFLELLSVVLTEINWETLPVKRSLKDVVYKGKKSRTTTFNSRYNNNYGDGYIWDGEDVNGYSSVNNNRTSTSSSKSNVNKFDNKFDDSDFDRWYLEQKQKNWGTNIDKTEVENEADRTV
jgi:hypothetical protein